MPKQLQKDIERSFPYMAKGMNKGYEFAHEYNPELAELLKQIFAILMRPLVALKAKLYRTFLRPFKKLEQKNIPVFRIGMVLVIFSIVYTKDFSFSFSIGTLYSDLCSRSGKTGRRTQFSTRGRRNSLSTHGRGTRRTSGSTGNSHPRNDRGGERKRARLYRRRIVEETVERDTPPTRRSVLQLQHRRDDRE